MPQGGDGAGPRLQWVSPRTVGPRLFFLQEASSNWPARVAMVGKYMEQYGTPELKESFKTLSECENLHRDSFQLTAGIPKEGLPCTTPHP